MEISENIYVHVKILSYLFKQSSKETIEIKNKARTSYTNINNSYTILYFIIIIININY